MNQENPAKIKADWMQSFICKLNCFDGWQHYLIITSDIPVITYYFNEGFQPGTAMRRFINYKLNGAK
jgi:hypothetical protein